MFPLGSHLGAAPHAAPAAPVAGGSRLLLCPVSPSCPGDEAIQTAQPSVPKWCSAAGDLAARKLKASWDAWAQSAAGSSGRRARNSSRGNPVQGTVDGMGEIESCGAVRGHLGIWYSGEGTRSSSLGGEEGKDSSNWGGLKACVT